MIGPLPPPTGGQSVLLRNLMESRLAQDLSIQALDIGHGPMRAISRLLLTFRLLTRLFLTLWRHPTVRVIHVHSSAGTPLFEKGLFILLATMWRKRALLHMHGGRFRETWARYGWFRRWLTQAILAHCDAVIVLSEGWLPFYRSEIGYQGKLHCLPNSVPTQKVEIDREDKRVCILYVGHLKPEKGLLDLREAWRRLPESARQRSLLLLMGEGDTFENEQRVRAAYADCSEEEVHFLGPLSGSEKWAAFARADILVLPSHSEDLPLTLLEGMALGLPLVATRVGAISSLITHEKEGYLVEAHDVDGLAQALFELVNSSDQRAALGRAGQQKFELAFTFESYLTRLKNIYDALLV